MTDFCIRYPNLIRKDMRILPGICLTNCFKTIKWHKIFENLGLLVSIYQKIILIIATDGLTKELCIGAYLVAKQVIQLNRRSSPLFTAKKNKQLLAVSKRMQGSVSRTVYYLCQCL